MRRLDLDHMSVEWQNFFLSLYNRVGGASAPSNSDMVEKSGSITQIEIRSHNDLQDLEEGDPHPQYLLTSANPRIYSGPGIFGGPTGVTITIGATMAATTYRVSIQATGSSLTRVGTVGVINKTTTTFDIINSGSDSSSSFDWIVVASV